MMANPATISPSSSVGTEFAGTLDIFTLENGAVAVVPPSNEHSLRWLTALSAAGIPYDVQLRRDTVGVDASFPSEPEKSGWLIVLSADVADRAVREILAYEAANRDFPPPPFKAEEKVSDTCIMSAVVVVGFLLLAFLKTGAVEGGNFLAAGAVLDSAAVKQGEWWRLTTALALHVDAIHLLSNSLCLLVFGAVVAARTGVGIGWLGILAGGSLGNLMSVWLSPDPFRAVGASTAVFAALGTLVVLRFAHLNHAASPKPGQRLSFFEKRWLPWLAGVGALGLLGTASGSHLEGHLFGFLAGLGVGAALSPLCGFRSSAFLQQLLFAAFLGLNVWAWTYVS